MMTQHSTAVSEFVMFALHHVPTGTGGNSINILHYCQ